jgi:hypothetical protein
MGRRESEEEERGARDEEYTRKEATVMTNCELKWKRISGKPRENEAVAVRAVSGMVSLESQPRIRLSYKDCVVFLVHFRKTPALVRRIRHSHTLQPTIHQPAGYGRHIDFRVSE